MSKKVFIGNGHGGDDGGAVGLKGILEKNLNLAIGQACQTELERHDVIVLMSRTKDENDPLADEIRECNAFKPNLAIDIHNNAGGGDGFEAYYSVNSGISKALATSIETEVKSIGQNSRGCKTRKQSDGQDYYGFIRKINAPAVLVECAFVDTKDVEIIDEAHEQKTIGIAIAKGVLKTLGITWVGDNQQELIAKAKQLGILQGDEYWLGVIKGERVADGKSIQDLINNAVAKLQ